jgi:hypothetical protein
MGVRFGWVGQPAYVHPQRARTDVGDGQDLFVRLWNTGPGGCEGRSQLWKPAAQATRCNLDVSALAPLEATRDQVARFPVRGNDVLTLRISFGGG